MFHGDEPLCDMCVTKLCETAKGEAIFEQDLQFRLPLHNVPRMAKLCFTLSEKKPNRGVSILDL